MGDAEEQVRIVAAIFYITVLAAFLIPVGITAITDVTHTDTVTIDQEEDVRITIEGNLDSNATDIEDPLLLGDPQATVKLINSETGESTKKTFGEGETKEMHLSNKTVVVELIDVIDASNARIRYDYPEKFEWDNDTLTLWDILDLGVVVALLTVLTGMFVWVAY